MLLALGVVMIVSVALIMLAAGASAEGRSMIARSRTAQVDQMLLAGVADAAIRLDTAIPLAGTTWTVTLPATLADQGKLTAAVESADDRRAVLVISASYAESVASQTVTFALDGTHWRVVAAELVGRAS